jgi:hypothetical protein
LRIHSVHEIASIVIPSIVIPGRCRRGTALWKTTRTARRGAPEIVDRAGHGDPAAADEADPIARGLDLRRRATTGTRRRRRA